MSKFDPTDSVFLTIKRMLGLPEDDASFDTEIRSSINSAFMTLIQLGVLHHDTVMITGETESWKHLSPNPPSAVYTLPEYVYLKTRLAFDPPANSFLVTALEKQIKELEWRYDVGRDTTYD